VKRDILVLGELVFADELMQRWVDAVAIVRVFIHFITTCQSSVCICITSFMRSSVRELSVLQHLLLYNLNTQSHLEKM